MKIPELPPVLLRPLPLWLVLLAAAYIAVSPCIRTIQTTLRDWNKTPDPSWIGVDPRVAKAGERVYDVDTHLIHGGLAQVNTLPETLRWWHGTWVGQVPFYRPLTSYVFWFQWKGWGDYEVRYLTVAVTLHVIAVLLFASLAYRLFGYFNIPRPDLGAVCACLLFTRESMLLDLQPGIVAEIYNKWKNQPDALTLGFFSLSLILYLRQKGSPKPESASRALWTRAGASVFYVLTCLTKEAGIFLPLLLPFIEADSLRQGGEARRTAIRRMAPLFVLLALYLILRTLFLRQVVGFQYGSNDAWWYRLAIGLLGRVSVAVVNLQWTELFLSAAILAVIGILLFLRHRPLAASGAILFLLAVAGGLGTVQVYQTLGVAWDIPAGFVLLTEEPMRSHALASAAILLLTASAFRFRPFFAATTYLWTLLALGMTLFSPSVIHRFYIINAGFTLLWVGGGLLLAGRIWQGITAARRPPSQMTLAPSENL